MTLPYGFVKAKVHAIPGLKASRRPRETQYHIHVSLDVNSARWDAAINVGTDDADDLLKYRLVYDFHHPVTATLARADAGPTSLTDQPRLPALDFLRSDILSETGGWRLSDVMDGSAHPEPAATLLRLLSRAQNLRADVYVFGRFYSEGDGVHDVHMNQGSTGNFRHREGDDSNDHNDIWQDGGLMVDLGENGWAAYFAAFEKQLVPTDSLGNPEGDSAPI